MADERKVLSKETVKAEMLSTLTFDIIMSILETLLCGGMAALWLFLMHKCFDNFMPLFAHAIGALFGIAAFAMIFFIALGWYEVAENAYIAKRCAFEIVEDRVERIVEDERWEQPLGFVERWRYRLSIKIHYGDHLRYKNAFYFAKCGRVYAQKCYSDFTMCGDMFYIVIINGKNQRVWWSYPAKLYRYEK